MNANLFSACLEVQDLPSGKTIRLPVNGSVRVELIQSEQPEVLSRWFADMDPVLSYGPSPLGGYKFDAKAPGTSTLFVFGPPEAPDSTGPILYNLIFEVFAPEEAVKASARSLGQESREQ